MSVRQVSRLSERYERDREGYRQMRKNSMVMAHPNTSCVNSSSKVSEWRVVDISEVENNVVNTCSVERIDNENVFISGMVWCI